ncbi:MAG: hypothetical protein ACYCTB_09255 [bacterium]
MEILNAYCFELDKILDPYEARSDYFYFHQDNNNFKFHFYCRNESCKIELVGANIYKPEEAVKRPPYFRTKPNVPHNEHCEYYENGKVSITESKTGTYNSDPIKDKIYPAIFILDEPKINTEIIRNISDKELTKEIITAKIKAANKNYNTSNLSETRYLEKIVNYFEGYPDCDYPLKIGNMTRKYKNWFKKLGFFEDGKDYIFYDYISGIKKYGNNYLITFKSKSYKDKLPFSAYIKEEAILKYRGKRYFTETIDYLINNIINSQKTDEIPIAYFIGTYPEKSSEHFIHYDIPINDLRHFVIKSTVQKS